MGALLIFGATSGIGKAVLDVLKPHQRIIAVARDIGKFEGHDPNVVWRSCDIRNQGELEKIYQEFGLVLDGVINCVGVGAYAPFESKYADYWDEIFSINVRGALNIITATLEHAPQCKMLLGIGSVAAHRPSPTPGNDVYAASKAAFARLHRDFRFRLRQEGKTMKVCLIEPAFVGDTGFGKTFFRSAPEREQDLYSSFEALTPKDVADAVAWCLAQPENVDVTDITIKPLMQPN